MEEKACIEVRGQLGGRSLTWVFPVVGAGDAPGGLRVFSISCPAKSSIREDFEVRTCMDLRVGRCSVERVQHTLFSRSLLAVLKVVQCLRHCCIDERSYS